MFTLVLGRFFHGSGSDPDFSGSDPVFWSIRIRTAKKGLTRIREKITQIRNTGQYRYPVPVSLYQYLDLKSPNTINHIIE